MGDCLVPFNRVRMHRGPDGDYVVCADSDIFPLDIPIAQKVASA
jgi:hypothetical protein